MLIKSTVELHLARFYLFYFIYLFCPFVILFSPIAFISRTHLELRHIYLNHHNICPSGPKLLQIVYVRAMIFYTTNLGINMLVSSIVVVYSSPKLTPMWHRFVQIEYRVSEITCRQKSGYIRDTK